jgi:D-alanine--poly(phosphoribitol) ligase subunit 1
MINKINESLVKFSDRNALFIREQFFTYGQVASMVSDIHHSFYNLIPKLNPKHIGVILYEDIESYSSCISVLLSGCGYVPLNPINPLERNLEIINQADIRVILASNRDQEKLFNPDGSIEFICTSELPKRTLDLDFPPVKDDDPAYVIFTSGSTGKPKGTPISRGNLNAFLDSVWHLDWKINEQDRFLQMSSMTFDMSVLTFIIPLCVGACIYTVPEDEIKYLYGYRLMEEQKITVIGVVPSTLSYLKPYFSKINLPYIRYSLVGGEASLIDLLERWQDCVPNSKIINMYGPAEGTVFTHTYNYQRGSDDQSYNGITAIGSLVKNMQTIIIDENGQEVHEGAQGELCISGPQLTMGYLKNQEKNQECFFVRQQEGKEKRFYKTGDIVFRNSENLYFYVGRSDTQVKIQGHRVELGEIERRAREITQTENTIAIAHLNEYGNYQIHLFIQQININREVITTYLKSKLPYYMIPSNITILEDMPLNINGKIDRLALSKMISTTKIVDQP